MKYLILVSLALLITISGCTFPDFRPASYGITVEEFLAEPYELQSGEPFDIKLKIRNTGPVKAESVFIKLFNTGIAEYTDLRCLPSSETVTNCEIPFNLIGEDVENQIPGESKICIWECVAPVIEKGVEPVTYNPSIRIYYSYLTNTVKLVTLASQEELIRIEKRGDPIPSQPSVTTGGPLSLIMNLKGPLKFWEGKNQVEFPVEFVVQNIGGGTVCELGEIGGAIEGCDNPENWNKVTLFSFSPDITFTDCDLATGEARLNLWNQEGNIVCNAWLSVRPGTRNVQKNIDVSIVYDYFTDKTTSVTVKGTSGFEIV